MSGEERLFAALNDVDDHLLERSGRRRAGLRPWAALLAAACVALAVLCLHRPSQELPPEELPSPIQILRFTGGEAGDELHLCSIQYGPQTSVGFAIYVNEEIYAVSEENGVYIIRPQNTLPAEEFPPIDLTIAHAEGLSKAEAIEAAKETLSETYAQVSEPEEVGEQLRLTAGDGDAWNDAHAEVACLDDGLGGSFTLTARYFTEATEGHGVRFWDMMGTFTVVYDDGSDTSPQWVGELQTAVRRLSQAIFENRLDDVGDLLSEGARVEGYGADVSGEVSVASVDYAPDNDQEPASATVSVKHRVNLEDSFNYLTLELTRGEDGRWLLTWAGIEK